MSGVFLLRLIFLVLGTAAGLFYILMMLRGRKYEGLVASLDKETFSNKDLCGAGFAMQEIGPFTLRGKLGKQLRAQAELLYGDTYQEYYARLYYARALSVTVLMAAVMLLIAALMTGSMLVLVLIGGVIGTAAIWVSQIDEMKQGLTKRRDDCLDEFPNVISKLALLVIICANVTRCAPFLHELNRELVLLLCITLAMRLIGLGLGFLLSTLFRFPYPVELTVTVNSSMRNNAAAATLAAQYFPSEVVFSPSVSPLFSQLTSSLAVRALQKRQQKIDHPAS